MGQYVLLVYHLLFIVIEQPIKFAINILSFLNLQSSSDHKAHHSKTIEDLEGIADFYDFCVLVLDIITTVLYKHILTKSKFARSSFRYIYPFMNIILIYFIKKE